jgi:hypothetical protein
VKETLMYIPLPSLAVAAVVMLGLSAAVPAPEQATKYKRLSPESLERCLTEAAMPGRPTLQWVRPGKYVATNPGERVGRFLDCTRYLE